MKRVSVIGTVHEDTGLANASELLVIIDRIQPNVIFLEMPRTFDDFSIRSHPGLEARAVNCFRPVHQVALVPVDRPTPSEEFFRNNKELFEAIGGRSMDYRRLVTWHKNYVMDYGFGYLNSEHYSKLWSELYEAERAAIEELADDRLDALFELWRHTNELRDEEMMKNMRDYCRHNASVNGVLLVGAAHRQSINDKSGKGSVAGSCAIQWEFPDLLSGSSP